MMIHWPKKMPENMGYVMFGRPEKLEDLFVTGEINIKDLRCNIDCLEESKRLEKKFEESLQIERNRIANHWKISYLNIQSLIAHHEDMVNDNSINNSDMIGLGETWLEKGTTIEIENFQGHFANFGRGKGLAGYTKLKLVEIPGIVSSKTHSAISLKTSQFQIIFLYLSKDYDKEVVYNLLNMWINEDIPTAIMGDMNENALKKSKLVEFMTSKGFVQLINETTFIQGSVIDHIYINQAMQKKSFFTKVDSCYYSGHDIISLYIEK